MRSAIHFDKLNLAKFQFIIYQIYVKNENKFVISQIDRSNQPKPGLCLGFASSILAKLARIEINKQRNRICSVQPVVKQKHEHLKSWLVTISFLCCVTQTQHLSLCGAFVMAHSITLS